MNTYISVHDFLRAPTGLVTTPLVGNVGRLSVAAVPANPQASLVVTPVTTTALNQYDQVYIFDGPNSEIVQVTSAGAAIGVSTIPITQLSFSHAAGTSYCTDGFAGSLATQIIDASAFLETICKQALWQTTYTQETLRMPSMRAAIDNQGMLVFRPRHFPVTIENGITIEGDVTNPTTYDQTQCIVDSGRQIVSVPWIVVSGTQGGQASTYSLYSAPPRTQQLWLLITYQAGYAMGALPGDVQRAAVFLTSDFVAQQFNPVGAAQIGQGKQQVVNALRGDFSGETLLYKKAKVILDNYTVQAF